MNDIVCVTCNISYPVCRFLMIMTHRSRGITLSPGAPANGNRHIRMRGHDNEYGDAERKQYEKKNNIRFVIE